MKNILAVSILLLSHLVTHFLSPCAHATISDPVVLEEGVFEDESLLVKGFKSSEKRYFLKTLLKARQGAREAKKRHATEFRRITKNYKKFLADFKNPQSDLYQVSQIVQKSCREFPKDCQTMLQSLLIPQMEKILERSDDDKMAMIEALLLPSASAGLGMTIGCVSIHPVEHWHAGIVGFQRNTDCSDHHQIKIITIGPGLFINIADQADMSSGFAAACLLNNTGMNVGVLSSVGFALGHIQAGLFFGASGVCVVTGAALGPALGAYAGLSFLSIQ